jgi:uncharacterized membrane protein
VNDRGSTLPLLIGFVMIALLTLGAAIAASDAYVQQRGLQAVCDGAAAAAAASAADLRRDSSVEQAGFARFSDARAAAADYLARDPERQDVHVDVELAADDTTLTLTCVQVEHIAFGSVFGKASGVRHVVHSSARAALR